MYFLLCVIIKRYEKQWSKPIIVDPFHSFNCGKFNVKVNLMGPSERDFTTLKQ